MQINSANSPKILRNAAEFQKNLKRIPNSLLELIRFDYVVVQSANTHPRAPLGFPAGEEPVLRAVRKAVPPSQVPRTTQVQSQLGEELRVHHLPTQV